jgi:alpha-1,3-rhamnosyl/mannosyltransferase
VVAGKPDPRYPEVRRQAANSRWRQRIVFTGYLEDSMRVSLLRASRVFVFPSRHEGFGLPPLEAMAEGVPVVASTAPALQEVLGTAAQLVEPDDVQGFARAILDLLMNAQAAEEGVDRGLRQAARFSWRECASRHLSLYRKLLGTAA